MLSARSSSQKYRGEGREKGDMNQQHQDEDFSVVVLASDLGIDARSLLRSGEGEEEWHDCSSDGLDEDFSDLEALQAFRFEGSDKSGNRIFRIVGKCFPASIISGERLKRYIFHKLTTELLDGPFCIVYMHSTVHTEDNNPGISILRWIYEELPSEYKERLQVVYFLHPGLRSRLLFATLGRLFLSGGKPCLFAIASGPRCDAACSFFKAPADSLYWKIKYVSRLQYLWEDMKKGEVEIPDFVRRHDEVLEHRPLTDYGIEPDPLHLTGVPAMEHSFGRYEDRWASRPYM